MCNVCVRARALVSDVEVRVGSWAWVGNGIEHSCESLQNYFALRSLDTRNRKFLSVSETHCFQMFNYSAVQIRLQIMSY